MLNMIKYKINLLLLKLNWKQSISMIYKQVIKSYTDDVLEKLQINVIVQVFTELKSQFNVP